MSKNKKSNKTKSKPRKSSEPQPDGLLLHESLFESQTEAEQQRQEADKGKAEPQDTWKRPKGFPGRSPILRGDK
jgi:hypothetical protein